jgi:hypothetical protein
MRSKYSSVAGASIPSDVRSIAISLHSGAALELTSLEFRVATKGCLSGDLALAPPSNATLGVV